MPDAPKQLKVFLCHSSHDKQVVREVYKKLNSEGWIDPWLDAEKLLPGQDWNLEIEKAVESSHIVLVFLSNNSVNKEGYIQKELRLVLDVALNMPEETIFVIPVKLEECQIPRRLQSWQWLTYFPSEERANAYERLLRSLKIRADKLGIQTDSPKTSKTPEVAPELRETPAIDTKKSGNKFTRYWLYFLVGLLPVIWFAIGVLWPSYIDIFKSPTPIITRGPVLESTVTPTRRIPTDTVVVPSFTPISNLPTPVPTLGIGSTMLSAKDGMTLLYVPNGEFIMGSGEGDSDEKPVHTANLDAFWIDQTEVTNKMYALCVAEGVCKKPADAKSKVRLSYYGDSKFDNYPVIHVDWEMANTYCIWANRQLPTEAQWEKAARGIDGQTFPWGNNEPNNDLLNYNNIVGDTTEVGRYPGGMSPYGAFDMSGNVWEWVADWYDENYYSKSPTFNPPGPVSGASRVLRGGSWNSIISYIHSSKRIRYAPWTENYFFGFRCAMDASP